LFYDGAMSEMEEAELQAFTADRVRALTGLTLRQLQYWDEQAFVRPSLTARQGRGRKRLYSFRDLVSLKVAAQLRRHGISLQQIRKVNAHLRKLDYRTPLAELRFFVDDGRLYFEESGTVRTGRRPEQIIAIYAVPVGVIAHDLAGQIAKLRTRPHGQIERRRGALGGRPLIKGTRIAVDSIRHLAEQGADEAEILAMYPDLTSNDVRAALASEAPPRSRRKAG
jgi:uncharacterized protein (DUF433 family)